MNFCRVVLPLFSLLCAIAPSALVAQTPPPRLNGRIRGNARVVLAGSASSRVRVGQDLGPVPDDRPLHGVTLVFRRSEPQQKALDELVAAQQDPASPEFHHWLTPEGFGQRFGMAEDDLQTTKRWLTEQGFTIVGVSRARDRISFSGSARQVAKAFSTSLHRYRSDGEVHTSPNSDVSLPAELAAVTHAVLHLSDIRPVPMLKLPARPAYSALSTSAHFLTPADLAVMYDIPQQSGSYSPGQGQVMAVVGQSYVDLTYGSLIRQSLSSTTYVVPVLVPGTGVEAVSPTDAVESEVDLEYASGILTNGTLLLVYVGSDPNFSVFDAVSFAIDANVAPVISISYGLCETLLSPADVDQGNALFQQASAQGQTLVAASGDGGSTACVRIPPTGPLSTAQRQSLAVDYPASSPFVTAVGGTQMTPDSFAPGNTTYWATATPPLDLSKSLLSYVPEVAWNEDSAKIGIFAGGGGASAMFSRPAWQAALAGIPTGTTRLVPDIALQASGANPGFLFCTDRPEFALDGQNPSCNFGSYPVASYPLAGGTSFAAPTFAAMVALLNQDTQSLGQGNVNPVLYGLAGSATTASSVFHDILSGTNACASGIPDCSAAGESGFDAAAGYDQATGLGSLDYLHLAAAWPVGGPALDGTVTLVSAENYTVDPSATDGITIYVDSTYTASHPPTAPTGSVAVAVDGAVVQNLALSTTSYEAQGKALYTVTVPAAAGSHVVVVTYPGDSTHSPSSNMVAILVGKVVASGGIALAAGNVTLPANGSATTGVTITPSGGYNGRLTWALSLASATGASVNACYSISSPAIQGVTSVALSLRAGTACSSALPAARVAGLTGVAKAMGQGTSPPHPNPWQAAPVVACVLVCCLRFSKRRLQSAGLFVVLLVAAAASTLTGCGGSSSNGSSGSSGSTPPAAAPPPVVPPPPSAIPTYTATLTATDSVNKQLAASTTFIITLQ